MSINELIARGTTPVQIESPVNRLAKVLQIQGAQQNIARGEMEQDQYRAGVEQSNRLADLYRSRAKDETDDVFNARLRSSGFAKNAMENEDFADKRLKTRTTADKDDIETTLKHVASWRDVLGTATNPEQAAQFIQLMHSDPRMAKTPVAQVPLDQALAQIGTTPESFDMWKKNASLGATKFIEANKPTYQQQNLGGTSQTLALPGLGGPATVANTATITQSPDNAATQATAIANNKATVGATYAHAEATREIANATRDAAKIQTGFTNEQGLRKEFEGLKEVTNYKQAYPAYAAVKDAVGRNTPQSDINLVYAIAKLYDPTSVVREGEYATVANSPNIPERVKGYAQYLAGGGRLSPETKAQILAEAQGRIGTYEAEAKKAKTSYENIARKRGMDPASVFADMGDMVEGGAKPPPNAISVPDDIRALLTKHSGKK